MSDEQKAQITEELRQKEAAYKGVFYGRLSPKQLGTLALPSEESTAPITTEEKRSAKLAELDAYSAAYVQAYSALCKINGVSVDPYYLMQNGFGMGAIEFYDDKDLDELILKDEQIANDNLQNEE